MTPCPVSWWAVKGPERESQPLLPPCLALSLLSGLFFWELPRNWSCGEMTVVVRKQLRWLVCVQARKSPAEAGKGEKLGPLSLHRTWQLAENVTWGPFQPSLFYSSSPLPFFLFCGRVRVSLGERKGSEGKGGLETMQSKHPSLSHVSGPALWAGSNWTFQPVSLSLCLSWLALAMT